MFTETQVKQCLMSLSPFIYELFSTIGYSSIPDPVLQLLKEACRRTDQMFSLWTRERGLPKELEEKKLDWNYRETGSYYSQPQIRTRPRYTKDNQSELDRVGCNKAFDRKREMTGGLMILWCRHRICQGFHVMVKAEGRNDVMSAVLTRWKRAPRVICYDYACDLMRYSITREPSYFKETLFVIDQLHIKNHWDCSECFDFSQYKASGTKELFAFNDQVAEQGNSLIDMIRVSCQYMSLGRFMDFTRLHLEVRNRIRIRTLQQIMESVEKTDGAGHFGLHEMINYINQLKWEQD